MKSISRLKAVLIALVVLMMVGTLSQCSKTDGVVNPLDRKFSGVYDSTVFSAYYNKNVIAVSDINPDVNDIINTRGIEGVIKEYCGTSNCHGGPISPKLSSYEEVMKYVTPGTPESSALWEYITTNDYNKAMPPVASGHELSIPDKSLIYNWIRNGAKERPDLSDFRPAAVRLINNGCGSANCHNQATATGAWARKGLISGLTAADTASFTYLNPSTGAVTIYCQLTNVSLRNQVWDSYKDSVRKFYTDTLANASFRPYKIFSTPISAVSTRGPLQTYDDLMLDINYPKSARSNTTIQYTDTVTGKKYYVKGNYLNVVSTLVSRVDSTLLPANPFTGIFNASHQGDMAYGDGGLKSSEIALIKAWYFADPNVPDIWKYGKNNTGILKYRKSGNLITKK